MATIKIGAVQIEIPTSELGEAMRQLAPFIGVEGPPAAAAVVSVSKKNGSWPFPTGDKPATAPAKSAEGQKPSAARSATPIPDADAVKERAAAFLETLVNAELWGGASPDAVMQALAASHPKGIGSRMQGVNAFFRALGFADADLYTNDRDENGMRLWKAGPRAQEALDKIRKPSASVEDDAL